MQTSRLRWEQLPLRIQQELEEELGSTVAEETVQHGGFSPGLASRLLLANGHRVFVKAISAERNPRAPHLYRREAAVMAVLPETTPAPRLQAVYDDGEWVALVLDDVDGRSPGEPWTGEDLDRVLDTLSVLARTPAPAAAPDIRADLLENFSAWRRLAAAPTPPPGLDPWAAAHLDELAELETGWTDAAAGDTLLHADLRADNLLLTDTAVLVVDWPYAVAGAPWMDLLLFLVSIHDFADPAQLWATHPLAAAADPDGVTAVLAAIAGDFTECSMQPPPPNIPGLRDHQRAKAAAALRWLRQRLDTDQR